MPLGLGVVLALGLMFLLSVTGPAPQNKQSIQEPSAIQARVGEKIDQLYPAAKPGEVLPAPGVTVLDTGRDEEWRGSSEAPRPGPVKVEAYIEMMCPDSGNFVVHDLGPERYPADLWAITELTLVTWVRFLQTKGYGHKTPIRTSFDWGFNHDS